MVADRIDILLGAYSSDACDRVLIAVHAEPSFSGSDFFSQASGADFFYRIFRMIQVWVPSDSLAQDLVQSLSKDKSQDRARFSVVLPPIPE